jgi:hypothetical protein
MSMALGLLGLFGATMAGRASGRRFNGTTSSVLGADWLFARRRSRT